MKKILLIIIGILFTLVLYSQDRERKIEKEIDLYYFNATDYYFFHEYDSAIIKLDVLDFLYEENSNIKFFLGMCYFFKGDFQNSIKYLEQVNDVIYTMDYQNGKYAPHITYFYLAFSYEKMGKINDAIENYGKYMVYEKEENIIVNTAKKIETLKLIYNKTD
jgi:tetratricopeptide (TPR) repeat protein